MFTAEVSDERIDSIEGNKLEQRVTFISAKNFASSLKCLTERIAKDLETFDELPHEEEKQAEVSLSEAASKIAHSKEEFRKFKHSMQKSGIVTNFAMQQIIPEILGPQKRNIQVLQDRFSSKDSNVPRLTKHASIREFISGCASFKDSEVDRSISHKVRRSRDSDSVSLGKETSSGPQWRQTVTFIRRSFIAPRGA